LVQSLAGPGGSVLDVGAGTGRASLPLARAGHPVTAVEPTASMLDGLRELAEGLPITIVEGRWPEVGGRVTPHRVVMSAHVVYDLGAIGPFLQGLNLVAEVGVVIELTPAHPWAHLSPYYLALHGLNRPDGPRIDDLVDVIKEELGVNPEVDAWRLPTDLWFESMDEILEFYGRRLVLPPARWGELGELLEPDVVGESGRLQVAPLDRDLCTVWWRR
jgi:SAM-dependent methyltransferase